MPDRACMRTMTESAASRPKKGKDPCRLLHHAFHNNNNTAMHTTVTFHDYFFLPLAPRFALRSRLIRSSSNLAMRATSPSWKALRCSCRDCSSFFVAAQMAGSAPDASPAACPTHPCNAHANRCKQTALPRYLSGNNTEIGCRAHLPVLIAAERPAAPASQSQLAVWWVHASAARTHDQARLEAVALPSDPPLRISGHGAPRPPEQHGSPLHHRSC